MTAANYAVLALHIAAAISGWGLFKARPEVLRATSKRMINLSPTYLRYIVIVLTTTSSTFYVFLQGLEWLGWSHRVGGIFVLQDAQAISTALSFCLVHFYYFRVLGQADDAGQATSD